MDNTRTEVYIFHLIKNNAKNNLIIQTIRDSLRDTIFFQRTKSVFRVIDNANDIRLSSKIEPKDWIKQLINDLL